MIFLTHMIPLSVCKAPTDISGRYKSSLLPFCRSFKDNETGRRAVTSFVTEEIEIIYLNNTEKEVY